MNTEPGHTSPEVPSPAGIDPGGSRPVLPANARAAARHWIWAAIVQGLTVISGVLIARHLGPDGRGTAAKVMLWPMLVLNFGFLGVPQAISLRWRGRPSEAPGLVASALRQGLALGIIEGIILAGLTPFILADAGASLVRIGQAFALILPLAFCGWVGQTAYLSSGRVHASGAFSIVQPLVMITALLAALAAGPLTPLNVLSCYLLARIAASIVPLLFLARLAPAGPFGAGAPGLLRDGSGHFAESLTAALVLQSELILASVWLASSDMGRLTVWLSYVGLGVSPVASLAAILFLRLGDSGGVSERHLAIAKAFRIALAIILVASCAMAAAGPAILPRVFGPGFRPSWTAIGLLCAVSGGRALCGLLTTSLRALGHARFAIICHLVYLAVVIAASPLTMGTLQLTSCLLGTLAGTAAMLVALLGGLLKLGVPFRELALPRRSDLSALWNAALPARARPSTDPGGPA